MMTRRQMLGCGFGSLGLAGTLQAGGAVGTHFPAKAKHVIFLFLNGGLSQVDTFDPKPELTRQDGHPLPGPKVNTDSATGNLMKSPFAFRKCGQSGLEVSELFTNVARHADRLCVIRSMQTEQINHDTAHAFMNTGSIIKGRPSMGSWLLYGLGSATENLPGFIVLTSAGQIGRAHV